MWIVVKRMIGLSFIDIRRAVRSIWCDDELSSIMMNYNTLNAEIINTLSSLDIF